MSTCVSPVTSWCHRPLGPFLDHSSALLLVVSGSDGGDGGDGGSGGGGGGFTTPTFGSSQVDCINAGHVAKDGALNVNIATAYYFDSPYTLSRRIAAQATKSI